MIKNSCQNSVIILNSHGAIIGIIMPQTNSKSKKSKNLKSKKETKAKNKNLEKTSELENKKLVKNDTSQPKEKDKEETKKKLENEKLVFQVNDYIVYPSQGIGKIVSIEPIKIMNQKKLYYIIQIFDKNLTIKIPVENVESTGIRPIIKKNDVKKVLKILEQEQDQLEEDWKIRYQNNLNKIKSGNIFEIAEVCRNLYKRARDKELSLMERRLYETAYALVTGEISYAKGITLEESKNLVSELLSKQ